MDIEDTRRKYKEPDNSKQSKKFIKSIEKANEAKSISPFPFFENPTTDYNTYFSNTVQDWNEENTKPGKSKIDPDEIEVFKIFCYQNISFELDYYEV